MKRMLDFLVAEFGPKLGQNDWMFLAELPFNQMVEEFLKAASRLVDEAFPKKAITTIVGDQPIFTEELRKLRRQQDRAYQRGAKTLAYISIQISFT